MSTWKLKWTETCYRSVMPNASRKQSLFQSLELWNLQNTELQEQLGSHEIFYCFYFLMVDDRVTFNVIWLFLQCKSTGVSAHCDLPQLAHDLLLHKRLGSSVLETWHILCTHIHHIHLHHTYTHEQRLTLKVRFDSQSNLQSPSGVLLRYITTLVLYID